MPTHLSTQLKAAPAHEASSSHVWHASALFMYASLLFAESLHLDSHVAMS